ncbi:MAG: glutamyl-tRNA reductase [Acidimicrobiales bacterium]|nr:MAG: glutamyl-tRNA reductase [Acidimicrobiales bacterium]
MSVIAVELSHKTGTLELLERCQVHDDGLRGLLKDLQSREHVSEVVVLQTCNRLEVYAAVERFHGGVEDVRDGLSEQSGVDPEELSEHLAVYHDLDAARHLFSVAAGLESVVVGEHEILGQVRDAWNLAQGEGVVGPNLNLMFRHALTVGKRVRTETAVGRRTVSVARAAVEMASAEVGGLDGKRVLVLGAGTVARSLARSLREERAGVIVVASRTKENAAALAGEVDGSAVDMSEASPLLSEVDCLFTSTGADSFVIDCELLRRQTEGRREPLLVVDVAVPRDVDPAARQLERVRLLDMEDLRGYTETSRRSRLAEVEQAASIVEEELVRWEALVSAREVAPLLRDLHAKADAVVSDVLSRAPGRLGSLSPDQRALVEDLLRRAVAKVLHDPTTAIREAAGTPRGERLAEALRDLFRL